MYTMYVKLYVKCKLVIWEYKKYMLNAKQQQENMKFYVKCMLVIWKMKNNSMLDAKSW